MLVLVTWLAVGVSVLKSFTVPKWDHTLAMEVLFVLMGALVTRWVVERRSGGACVKGEGVTVAA
jgi:hypothetical protein